MAVPKLAPDTDFWGEEAWEIYGPDVQEVEIDTDNITGVIGGSGQSTAPVGEEFWAGTDPLQYATGDGNIYKETFGAGPEQTLTAETGEYGGMGTKINVPGLNMGGTRTTADADISSDPAKAYAGFTTVADESVEGDVAIVPVGTRKDFGIPGSPEYYIMSNSGWIEADAYYSAADLLDTSGEGKDYALPEEFKHLQEAIDAFDFGTSYSPEKEAEFAELLQQSAKYQLGGGRYTGGKSVGIGGFTIGSSLTGGTVDVGAYGMGEEEARSYADKVFTSKFADRPAVTEVVEAEPVRSQQALDVVAMGGGMESFVTGRENLQKLLRTGVGSAPFGTEIRTEEQYFDTLARELAKPMVLPPGYVVSRDAATGFAKVEFRQLPDAMDAEKYQRAQPAEAEAKWLAEASSYYQVQMQAQKELETHINTKYQLNLDLKDPMVAHAAAELAYKYEVMNQNKELGVAEKKEQSAQFQQNMLSKAGSILFSKSQAEAAGLDVSDWRDGDAYKAFDSLEKQLFTLNEELRRAELTGDYDGTETLAAQKLRLDAEAKQLLDLQSEANRRTQNTGTVWEVVATEAILAEGDPRDPATRRQWEIRQSLDSDNNPIASIRGEELAISKAQLDMSKDMAVMSERVKWWELAAQRTSDTGLVWDVVEEEVLDDDDNPIDIAFRLVRTGDDSTEIKKVVMQQTLANIKDLTARYEADMTLTVAEVRAQMERDGRWAELEKSEAIANIAAEAKKAVADKQLLAAQTGKQTEIDILAERIKLENQRKDIEISLQQAMLEATMTKEIELIAAKILEEKEMMQMEIDMRTAEAIAVETLRKEIADVQSSNALDAITAKIDADKEAAKLAFIQKYGRQPDEVIEGGILGIESAARVAEAKELAELETTEEAKKEKDVTEELETRERTSAELAEEMRAAEREALAIDISAGTNIAQDKTAATAFTTGLNTAINNAKTTGDYTSVESALSVPLPPAPSGVFWDSASGSFQQRTGFQGREMTATVQKWIANMTPAFKSRDRAEQATREATRIQVEMNTRLEEKRQADADFRQYMTTGDIDSA